MVFPVILAAALAGLQNPTAGDDKTPPPDSSLSRISVRLSRPERIHLSTDRQLQEPTFRIEIHQHPYFTEVPFIWTFAGGGMPLTAPGMELMGGSQLPKSFGGGTDILPLFMGLKRSHDERAAKAEVSRLFAEFCATHVCVISR